MLLIIEKIVRELLDDFVLVTEHQQTRYRRISLAVFTPANSTNLVKKILVLQIFPNVTGTGVSHSDTITADTVVVKHVHIHIFKHQHILRPARRITQHRLNLVLRAVVVTLTIATVSSRERITVNIYRLIGALGTRHPNNNDSLAVNALGLNVFFGENVQADLVRIVDYLPELLDKIYRVWQINGMKRFIFEFLNAQQDNSTQRICERRVCLPNAVWQPTDSFLGFYTVILTVFF